MTITDLFVSNNREENSMSKDRYALFTDYVKGTVVATKHVDQFDEGSPDSGPSLLVKIAAPPSALMSGH